ncbi:MAG: hypothetical protein M3Q07_26165 [Pseudobdellovibrionaceae bacterium]|nr:hypothetical protein [Pseudobdellovibrionaceae bacterium]
MKPVLADDLKPLTFASGAVRIGVLICDESRSRLYFDEMKVQNIDALFVPNSINFPVSTEALLNRYTQFEADFDRLNSGRLNSISLHPL